MNCEEEPQSLYGQTLRYPLLFSVPVCLGGQSRPSTLRAVNLARLLKRHPPCPCAESA